MSSLSRDKDFNFNINVPDMSECVRKAIDNFASEFNKRFPNNERTITELEEKSKEDIFEDITEKMLSTYKAKNSDYGDSFSKVRKEYPNSICIRLSDKLERLKALKNGNEQLVKDESIKDTLMDLANYCILELIEMEIEENEN